MGGRWCVGKCVGMCVEDVSRVCGGCMKVVCVRKDACLLLYK